MKNLLTRLQVFSDPCYYFWLNAMSTLLCDRVKDSTQIKAQTKICFIR